MGLDDELVLGNWLKEILLFTSDPPISKMELRKYPLYILYLQAPGNEFSKAASRQK